jgi:hypothetical protein
MAAAAATQFIKRAATIFRVRELWASKASVFIPLHTPPIFFLELLVGPNQIACWGNINHPNLTASPSPHPYHILQTGGLLYLVTGCRIEGKLKTGEADRAKGNRRPASVDDSKGGRNQFGLTVLHQKVCVECGDTGGKGCKLRWQWTALRKGG